MVRRVGAVISLVLAGFAGVPRLEAHPLHSSFAEVRRVQGGVVMISVRLFADDFGAVLDSLETSVRGASRESLARRYVQHAFAINAGAVPIQWCGMRAAENMVWVCLRSAVPVAGSFRLRNALMFDRFPDQISIIRWTSARARRTFVLNARVPEARLD